LKEVYTMMHGQKNIKPLCLVHPREETKSKKWIRAASVILLVYFTWWWKWRQYR